MKLLIFGLGYTASFFAQAVRTQGWEVVGTVRSAAKAARLEQFQEKCVAVFRPELRKNQKIEHFDRSLLAGNALEGAGLRALVYDGKAASAPVIDALADTDAVLVSVPPNGHGDPVLRDFGAALAAAPKLTWIGYLSTIGVYGDHAGAWVDESSPCRQASPRSRQRLAAEADWLALGARSGKVVQIFRLGGIYGPGRSAIDKLRAGTANRLIKPGQVFNRIHVEDIAGILLAAMAHRRAGAIYNLCDDEPSPPQDVITFAADLIGVAPPPEETFDPAKLSAMAAEFYAENRRVSNALIKRETGYVLRYPNYRDGLRVQLELEEQALRQSRAGV